jgi:hypothetical protein
MPEFNVTFKVEGTFSTRVSCSKPNLANAPAMSEFFAAIGRASRGNARLLLNPEQGVAPSAAAVEGLLQAAGVQRLDWRGAHELLAIVEGEFAQRPEEREALAIVQAALDVAGAYPEDGNFQMALIKARGALAARKGTI